MLLAFLLALLLMLKGNEAAFLIINKKSYEALDYVMPLWTKLGEGLIWAPLVIYALFYRRDYLLAIAAAAIICAIFTQGGKRLIYPDELRPVLVLGKEKIRIVQGVIPHTNNSFPSGHTSSAFTLALLAAFIMRGRVWIYFFPLAAFFVGYSRIYLAHHFVKDVFAGILIGIISSYLALLIYERIRRRSSKVGKEQTAYAKASAEEDGNGVNDKQ